MPIARSERSSIEHSPISIAVSSGETVSAGFVSSGSGLCTFGFSEFDAAGGGSAEGAAASALPQLYPRVGEGGFGGEGACSGSATPAISEM